MFTVKKNNRTTLKSIRFIKLYYLGILFLFVINGFFAQDSLKPRWISVNLQGALIVNSSLSDVYYNQYQYDIQDHALSGNPGVPVCLGANAGIEALFGEKRWVRSLLGISYDYTNSSYKYKYDTGYFDHWGDRDASNVIINQKTQRIDVNVGASFLIGKKIHLAAMLSFNNMFNQARDTTGFVLSARGGVNFNNPNAPQGAAYYNYDSTSYYSNKNKGIIHQNKLLMSVRFRFNYDISERFSVFILTNLAIGHIAPLWMAGIQYWPLKKTTRL